MLFPIADISQYLFGPILFLLSLFMILLILVQRGRGGGLVGALGGPGGQSAFGTKAGDLFTRITVVTAAIWIFLLGFATWWYTEKGIGAALPKDAATTAGSLSTPSGQAAPAIGADSAAATTPASGAESATGAATDAAATTDAAAAGDSPKAEVEGKDLPAATAPEASNSSLNLDSAKDPAPAAEAAKSPETPEAAASVDAATKEAAK